MLSNSYTKIEAREKRVYNNKGVSGTLPVFFLATTKVIDGSIKTADKTLTLTPFPKSART
ncbi:MAG: hypothetical protein A2Z50_05560 [Nitrospirae bacterium RBG_19FT_COMBO_42_15]|nr:MAG: hypothetical protein A2Z50_05560 [Nitrospirae bacterium RBG_19FT_COMBO_42_15]